MKKTYDLESLQQSFHYVAEQADVSIFDEKHAKDNNTLYEHWYFLPAFKKAMLEILNWVQDNLKYFDQANFDRPIPTQEKVNKLIDNIAKSEPKSGDKTNTHHMSLTFDDYRTAESAFCLAYSQNKYIGELGRPQIDYDLADIVSAKIMGFDKLYFNMDDNDSDADHTSATQPNYNFH